MLEINDIAKLLYEKTKTLTCLTLSLKAHIIWNRVLIIANKTKGETKGTMDIHNKRDSNMKQPWMHTGNLSEKNYCNKFHNKCNLLHHQGIRNHLMLNVRSPQEESLQVLLRQHDWDVRVLDLKSGDPEFKYLSDR